MVCTKGDLREVRMGDYTLDQIAGNLILASHGALDSRPVLNKTGLNGSYDLDNVFLPLRYSTDTLTADTPLEEPGATFEEALKRQAGLKLIKETGPFPVSMLDGIERPTEN